MGVDIPLIDLEPWFAGGEADQTAVVEAVRKACEQIGFFLISGHRVDPGLIDQMYDLSRAFFDQRPDFKRQFPSDGPIPGGFEYFAIETERLAATRGEATPSDKKETMDFGPGFGGGPWPDRPGGLQPVWHDYYAAMDGLCMQLRFILARAANLPKDFFEDRFVDHMSSVRVINYPEPISEPLPGQLRAGAHTDYGFLTILRSEDKPGGLEVRNREGAWISPPALSGTFIVNLGDCLMRWTDDMWQSTLHRVVNPPPGSWGSSRRQSIAFFHNPARSAMIDTLPTFRKPQVAPKYPAITYGEYAADRQSRSQGVPMLALSESLL